MRRDVPHGCKLRCRSCGTIIYDRGRCFDSRGLYSFIACQHMIGVLCETDDFGAGWLETRECEDGVQRVCMEYVGEPHGGHYCSCALHDLDEPGQVVYRIDQWAGALHVVMKDDVLEVIEHPQVTS